MKTKVIGLDGRDSAEIELPAVFDTPYRPEVIHKVYVNVLCTLTKGRDGIQQLVRW